MYSLINVERNEKKTGKGINRTVLKKNIDFEDYLSVLTNKDQKHDKMNSLRNYKQEMFSIEQNKVSLSSYDDKRYILSDGICSLSYGHCNI